MMQGVCVRPGGEALPPQAQGSASRAWITAPLDSLVRIMYRSTIFLQGDVGLGSDGTWHNHLEVLWTDK